MSRPLAPLHLGDGAYVCDEDGSVVLRAGSHRASDCTDEVWLGPDEVLRLHDWLGHWFSPRPMMGAVAGCDAGAPFLPAPTAPSGTATSAPAHSSAGDVAGVESPARERASGGGGAPFSVWQESLSLNLGAGERPEADALEVLSPGLRALILRFAVAARMVELRPSPGTLAELMAATSELTLALAPTPSGALAQLRAVGVDLLQIGRA